MKQVYSNFRAVLLAFACFTYQSSFSQNPTTVLPSNLCSVIEDFNTSSGGFHSPSIYTESDYTEFVWSATEGYMIEKSGLTNRSASMISGIYENNQLSGAINIGFKYQVCPNAEYRIRVIKIDCVCTGGDNIIATTANGPEWTKFPSTSGQLCIRMIDADLIQGQRLRFEISIRNNGRCDFIVDDFSLGEISGAPLPVTFLGIVAKKENNGVEVTWDVAEEENVKGYIIERSTNGSSYSSIGFVNANAKPVYKFIDDQPAAGNSYYRVRNVDYDGQSKTSNVVKVVNKAAGTLKLFPVPAKDHALLYHKKLTKGSTITLSSLDGRTIRQIASAPEAIQTRISLNGLTPGMYILKFVDENGYSEAIKLIKQ